MSFFKPSFYGLCAAVMLVMATSINPLKAMDNLSEQKNDPRIALTPENLYKWKIREKKKPQEIVTWAVQGAMAKKEGDLEKAIPLLEQAALYENIGAFVDLADICKSRRNWIQATKWYVLAFQIEWLQKKTHHSTAKEWLESLPGEYPSIKNNLSDSDRKALGSFCRHVKTKQRGFFSYYSLDEKVDTNTNKEKNTLTSNTDPSLKPLINSTKMTSIGKLSVMYESNFHEPYLSPIETKLKEDWFYRMMIDEGSSDSFRETQGIRYFDESKFKKAIYCLHRLETPKALETLGKIYEVGCSDILQDYQKAAGYYKKSKTSLSYQKLGHLYEEGHLGQIDYQKAAKYYELSQGPSHLCLVGLWYENTELGETNYQKAKDLYERSGTSLAFKRLGSLWESGNLGEPNLKKAKEYYKLSQEPSALFKLGYFYEIGLLEEPDYQKSVQYYLQSGTPEALANAMELCREGKVEKKECQIAYKSLLEFQHPYKNLMLIHLCKDEKFCTKIELVNPEKHIKTLEDQLLKILNTLQPSQQSFIRGILESFKENYDDALLHLSEALALGEKHAEEYLKSVIELQTMQQKLDSQKDMNIQEITSHLEELTSEESSSEGETFPNLGEQVEKLPDILLQGENNTRQTLPQRQKKTPEELKRKYQERLDRAKQKLGIIPLTPLNNIVTPRKIEFTFLSKDVEEAFENQMQNEKMKTLIHDISYKPWATEGEGKPEVLKYKYKNYKGCLSRRINGEDRLVYKVMGAKEVLIVSCEGHYKK